MQSFSGAAVAVIALAIAVTVMWRHHWQGSRLTVALMLLAGFGVTASGLAGDLLVRGGEALATATTEGTARLFGAGVPMAALAIVTTWIVVDVRDRIIHRATPWLALAWPTLLAVVGGVSTGLGLPVLDALGAAMTSASGWLGAVGGGA